MLPAPRFRGATVGWRYCQPFIGDRRSANRASPVFSPRSASPSPSNEYRKWLIYVPDSWKDKFCPQPRLILVAQRERGTAPRSLEFTIHVVTDAATCRLLPPQLPPPPEAPLSDETSSRNAAQPNDAPAQCS